MVRLLFWISGECQESPSMPLHQGPLWPGVVIIVRVPSMGQIDFFENDTYSIRAQKEIKTKFKKNPQKPKKKPNEKQNSQGTTPQKCIYEHTMNALP